MALRWSSLKQRDDLAGANSTNQYNFLAQSIAIGPAQIDSFATGKRTQHK